MAERFQYALWRLVPDVERGERINVGVVVHARRQGLLVAHARLDRPRVRALWPALDDGALDAVDDHLRTLVAVAAGDAAAGPLAALDRSDRFGWLVAPASTIVQPSPVHTGVCDDGTATAQRLFERLVDMPGRER